MQEVLQTINLINAARRELALTHTLFAAFRAAHGTSEGLFTGANNQEPCNRPGVSENASQLRPDPLFWRGRAAETRDFAEHMLQPHMKRLLLEIANSYERFAE
jgi:hypothetical protein